MVYMPVRDALKQQLYAWMKDPCYDLADGFGEDELSSEERKVVNTFEMYWTKRWKYERELDAEYMFFLKVNESCVVDTPTLRATVVRVPGGWLYYLGSDERAPATFVPWGDHAFQESVNRVNEIDAKAQKMFLKLMAKKIADVRIDPMWPSDDKLPRPWEE